MQVLVDNRLTHYEQSGDDNEKTVILVHGWGDSSKGFKSLQAAIAQKYRVIAVDLPGFGGSQPPTVPWGLDDYGQFVGQFLSKLDIRQLWGVVGHSNGGAVAIRAIAKGWIRPERLVLLASAGIRGTYKGRNRVYRVVAKTGKALVMPLPRKVKSRLRRKLYKTIGSDMLVAEHLQETFKRIVTDDVRQDAGLIAIPTLLIYGESDEQTPLVYGEMYHQLIANSTLEILPGTGHFVHLDQPAKVGNAVTRFLL